MATNAPAAINGPHAIIASLHESCTSAVAASTAREHSQINGISYDLARDLDLWVHALAPRPEQRLYETASTEYIFSLLNVMQGQYRNAFKGLRLVLELTLQGAYLSTNLVALKEWLKSQADTSWKAILDTEKGIFSPKYCRAFSPALADEAPAFRSLSETLYREMSECIHGNVPNRIPLPKVIAFDDDTFQLWHKKVASLRLIINFCLTMRYLDEINQSERDALQSVIMDQLGHMPSIREQFEGSAS